MRAASIVHRAGLLTALAGASLAVAAFGGPAHTAPHWEYTGDAGPSHWANLSPAFHDCAGHGQSPIDLAHFTDATLPALSPHYSGGGADIVNNGHTVQVDYPAGSTITVDGVAYTLKQAHVHLPSEHRLHGKSFPMEAHLVHADAAGHLAVVAVLFQAGKSNDAVAHLLASAPAHEGAPVPLPASAGVLLSQLLPADMDYYRYTGSLTTPPCTEGVKWLVLKHPMPASSQQLHALAALLGHPNNRPVQPVGARRVLQ